jgi:hypothetical protein
MGSIVQSSFEILSEGDIHGACAFARLSALLNVEISNGPRRIHYERMMVETVH